MLLPVWLVNLGLRLFVRGPLGRAKDPQQLRRKFERDAARSARLPKGANLHDDQIRRADDSAIPVVWASMDRPDRSRVILYLHGGAFIVGSAQTHRHVAAQLAGAAGTRALVPSYRLAPENPFPAGLEDALTCYRSLLGSHEPGQIAFAGDSAGGGLVFSLLLAAAEAGLPQPAAAVAFSPAADLTLSGASHRENAARDAMLPQHRSAEMVAMYLQGQDADQPKASPALARFDAPPPSLIFASEAEILRDDAVMLADALGRSGGDVQLELWPSLPHAWPVLTSLLRASGSALDLSGRFIRDAMDRTE